MASTIKVDNVQNQPGTNIINKCGTDVTVGASGDTVALACGASSSGFGRTGAVDWDTTPKTATFSGVNGSGYFVNTTGGVITGNLPAGTAGDIVAFSDYANTWGTNTFTISPDGSELINGGNFDVELTTNGLSVTLIYVDGTRGWKNIDDATSNVTGESAYLIATGGNTTITDGDYKIHVFTGPGTLAVTAGGTCAPCSGTGSNKVDYLVTAGGGGGGGSHGGGGGAGGMRVYMPGTTPMNAPACEGSRTVTATPYAIAVGAAGVGAGGSESTIGGNSVFSCITSTGGGYGGTWCRQGAAGGSGGGGGNDPYPQSSGAGNTPPTSPSQGNTGGNGPPGSPPANRYIGGGGGGGTATGTTAPATVGGPGGDGGYTPDAMIGPTAPSYGTPGPVGSTRYFAGGGGGGGQKSPAPSPQPAGTGGAGGGAAGASQACTSKGDDATINTGGGGGGGGPGDPPEFGNGGGGGSGIVMIRYKFQN